MIKVDKLNIAVDKMYQRVLGTEYTKHSSFEDIASGLVTFLQRYVPVMEKSGTENSRRDKLKTYFGALNDYLGVIDSDSLLSQRERLGNVMQKPYVCAIPEIVDMTPDEAETLGFTNAKLAKVWALSLNADEPGSLAA